MMPLRNCSAFFLSEMEIRRRVFYGLGEHFRVVIVFALSNSSYALVHGTKKLKRIAPGPLDTRWTSLVTPGRAHDGRRTSMRTSRRATAD